MMMRPCGRERAQRRRSQRSPCAPGTSQAHPHPPLRTPPPGRARRTPGTTGLCLQLPRWVAAVRGPTRQAPGRRRRSSARLPTASSCQRLAAAPRSCRRGSGAAQPRPQEGSGRQCRPCPTDVGTCSSSAMSRMPPPSRSAPEFPARRHTRLGWAHRDVARWSTPSIEGCTSWAVTRRPASLRRDRGCMPNDGKASGDEKPGGVCGIAVRGRGRGNTRARGGAQTKPTFTRLVRLRP